MPIIKEERPTNFFSSWYFAAIATGAITFAQPSLIKIVGEQYSPWIDLARTALMGGTAGAVAMKTDPMLFTRKGFLGRDCEDAVGNLNKIQQAPTAIASIPQQAPLNIASDIKEVGVIAKDLAVGNIPAAITEAIEHREDIEQAVKAGFGLIKPKHTNAIRKSSSFIGQVLSGFGAITGAAFQGLTEGVTGNIPAKQQTIATASEPVLNSAQGLAQVANAIAPNNPTIQTVTQVEQAVQVVSNLSNPVADVAKVAQLIAPNDPTVDAIAKITENPLAAIEGFKL